MILSKKWASFTTFEIEIRIARFLQQVPAGNQNTKGFLIFVLSYGL
jgi:hypothetical protein